MLLLETLPPCDFAAEDAVTPPVGSPPPLLSTNRAWRRPISELHLPTEFWRDLQGFSTSVGRKKAAVGSPPPLLSTNRLRSKSISELHLRTSSREAVRDFLPLLIVSSKCIFLLLRTSCSVLCRRYRARWAKASPPPNLCTIANSWGSSRCRTWYVTCTFYTLLISGDNLRPCLHWIFIDFPLYIHLTTSTTLH
jgi:hypothetical protein